MRLIIDIPDDEYNAIKNTAFVEDEKTMFRQNANDRKCTMGLFHIVDEIKNGTPITDNATNGDVIRAMFPDDIWLQLYARRAKNGWWNAPYQKGGKE